MNHTESTISALLMSYCLFDKHHLYVAPNIYLYGRNESDLISVTSSLYAHEYEIKISYSDFKKDFDKKHKHSKLSEQYKGNAGLGNHLPNYFWYAISFDIDINEIPPYAGLIKCSNYVSIIRAAPRLHTTKLSEKKLSAIARSLSFKIMNIYKNRLNNKRANEETDEGVDEWW